MLRRKRKFRDEPCSSNGTAKIPVSLVVASDHFRGQATRAVIPAKACLQVSISAMERLMMTLILRFGGAPVTNSSSLRNLGVVNAAP
ncbi:hypothetical protein SKP52_06860 [Sphingopyxis fribergensis]|uniref:Uncharacterized protein n=1 Tax=Sphingopyxis fribergensis TaxID=1515612 RepID=A0A0A7PEA7_9SPHN|nr:hypothetical protein [Sphingopyxis fribergensis]AJA08294.1 hypothetical protein SKP52_06860 [Sphingopyxis fribergensis]